MRRFMVLAVLLASLTVPVLAGPAEAAPTSTVVAIAGAGVEDGPALSAALSATGADTAADGSLYLADSTHNRIRKLTAGTMSTVAGTGDLVDGHGGFSGDGAAATAAQLFNPTRVRVTPAGDLLVVDSGNHRLRRIDGTSGVITTIAGNGKVGGAVAGTATSQPINANDVAYDTVTGDIDIADSASKTVWALHADGTTTALVTSPLVAPVGLAQLPNAGGLLIADSVNNAVYLYSGGTLTTVANNLRAVSTLAVAPDGTIYAGTSSGVMSFTLTVAPALVPGAPCTTVGTYDANGLVLTCKGVFEGPSFSRIAGAPTDVTTDGTAAANAPFTPTGGLVSLSGTTYVTNATSVDDVDGGGTVHTYLGGLTAPTAVAAAPSGGGFVVNGGVVSLVTSDGVVHPYAASSPTTTVTEGEPASQLPLVGPIVAAANGDLYFGSGDLIGVISWANQTVHIITPSLKALGGKAPGTSYLESARAITLSPDGTLTVLSDETDSNPEDSVIMSRVRHIDPVTGSFTQYWYGNRFTAMALGGDGNLYVATTRTVGSIVEQLGTDGSTALVAGGGHVTATSQNGTDLYLPDVAGFAAASDGGILIASKGAHRVFELQPGAVVSRPAPVTNLSHTDTLQSDGTVSTSYTWTAAAGMAADSHLEIGRYLGTFHGDAMRTDNPFQPGSTATSFTQVGEVPGQQYTITIYVVTANGDQSAPTTLTIIAPNDTSPPGAVTVGQGYSVDSSFAFDWVNPSDSDFSKVDVRIAPGTALPSQALTPVYSGTASTATVTGLTVGQLYTATFTTTDFAGNAAVPTRGYQFLVGSEPDPVLAAGPAAGSYTDGSTSFTPTALYDFSSTPACALDGVAVTCVPGTAVPLTGLSSGSHTFGYQLSTSYGNSPLVTRTWNVDTTAPAVGVSALPAFTVAASFVVKYAGADTGAGLDHFRVRYQRASYTGSWSAFAQPAALQHLTTRTATIGLPAGFTYCAQVQAVDKVGNVSAWSASRCTTRPLDDRSLATSGLWKRLTSSLYFGKTYTQTHTAHTALYRSGATYRQLAVLATTCKTCGSIGVYAGTKLIKSISLVSSTTKRQVLFVLPVITSRTGTIYLRVTSATGKNVEIDGLGIARA